MVIQDDPGSANSWVEIDITTQTFFRTYQLKSKASKNRIVLKAINSHLLEALQASSSLSGTRVTIKLASVDSRVYLEFKCEVPEENEIFLFEKQVDVVIELNNDDIVPEIPNSLECELSCAMHIQQMVLPVAGESTIMQICLTVEECHICKAKDKRDLDFVFACQHNRKSFGLPETGKLTLMSRETSPMQVVSAYNGLALQQGQCSLYNIKTMLRTQDLMTVFQKTCGLSWNKIVLGIQHESGVIVTGCWKDSLFVKFLITAYSDDND